MSAPEREPAEPGEMSRTADKAELARYYDQMLAIRRMEEALANVYALRKQLCILDVPRAVAAAKKLLYLK